MVWKSPFSSPVSDSASSPRSLSPSPGEWLSSVSDRGTAGTPKLRAVLFCRTCHSGGSPGGFFYLEGINPLLCLTAPRLPWPQAAWTVSQAGFGPTPLWASSALYRIIKYLLEMEEGKAALDGLFVCFSSPLKAEKMWSEVPVSHEVFGSQYPRRAWEQATQSTLLFRSLNVAFTTKGHSTTYLQKGRAFLNAQVQGTNRL